MSVTKKTKRKLINNYVDGWKRNNLELIVSTLSQDCIIIESHGPMYKGVNEIKSWVKEWIEAGSYVTKWGITSFYFIKDIAFFEWNFKCLLSGNKHELDGISIVKFKNNKISYIREYRTTKPKVA
ncbi:nuclear transport factor 2 family protein [Candidatus Gottesmanbacteria bacterium]|nr:nuclear transport factor 2 family protein [Candidatus Gottesmanbacteria bacterium]